MKSNETSPTMISDNLKELSKRYIELREASWKKLSNPSVEGQLDFDSLKTNYQNELKLFVERHLSSNFSTEQECLIAKFTLLFNYGNLEDNLLASIKQDLVQKEEIFPMLSKINEIIRLFKKNLFDFFTSYGSDYDSELKSFSLEKTNNQLANTIITTEINRVITDFTIRSQPSGQKSNFSVILKESDNQFEITLKK